MFFRDVTDTNQSESHTDHQQLRTPEIIWRLGGPEEDHQLHHCCWTGRVGKREEDVILENYLESLHVYFVLICSMHLFVCVQI